MQVESKRSGISGGSNQFKGSRDAERKSGRSSQLAST